MEISTLEKEVIFKGMTRPAMLFGVPLVPLIFTGAFIFLFAIWFNIYLLFLILPIYFIMKLLAIQDDFIYRLYFLKIKFFTPLYNKKYYGVKTFHATEYNISKKAFNYPELSILGLDKNPSFEKFIPYSSLISPNVVRTKDYMLMSTWKIDGVAFELADTDRIEANKRTLNMLFKAFANENVSFYVHNARLDIEAKLKATFHNSYLEEINKKYYEGFKNGALKINTLYLTLVYNPFKTKIDRSSFLKISKEAKLKEIKIYLKKMEEYSSRLEANLRSFKVTRLGIYKEEDKSFSTQLEFYNYLIGGRFTKVRALNAPLNEYLIGSLRNIQFNSDTIQLNYNDGFKQFARAIEIKDYTSETYIGILNTLMYLNINYTITQSFAPLPKHEAKHSLKKQEKQLLSSEDDSTTQLLQFEQALDELTNGEISFGDYHFSIIVYANSIKEVKDNTNSVINELNDLGFGVTIADIALPATYFSQFPTNYALRPRVSPISSKNYSSLVALHNFPQGRKNNNCWGEAVTILKTANKQPYYFNIHQIGSSNDFGEFTLGNFTALGQSGGGKTALVNFLVNQLMKFNNPKTFPLNIPDEKKKMTLIYLDKDKGALGNILSAGGRYISLENGVSTGFNPFMCDNTSSNIRNLNLLMKILVTRNGEILSSADEKKLSNAIDSVMTHFKKEERKYGISLLLENITPDYNDENSLKSRLELWKKENKFGWVFDNEKDFLNFPDNINIFGIDGTDFLDDPEVNGAMSFYILWRCRDLIDGRRYGLLIDEFWKWLANELVQIEAKDILKTIRKRNGFLGLASQSIEDVLELPIAKTIVEQSATNIYFFNEKAKEEDYTKKLNCTEQEFNEIKKFRKEEYKCLIKRSDEAVIASLDLSSLGVENLKILSTGEAYVNEVERIFNQGHLELEEKVKQLQKFYRG